MNDLEVGGIPVPDVPAAVPAEPERIIVDPVQEALAASRRASERAEEAAERAVNEMAALRDHLSRRFDELGGAFTEHTHSVLQPVAEVAEVPIDAAEDVTEDVGELPAEAVMPEPDAEKPPLIIQKRNRYRLRGR